MRTNFIEYGAVVKAVKFAFRDILLTENRNVSFPFIPFNFEALLADKKGSRRFYQTFTASQNVVRKYIDKWENKLQIHYELRSLEITIRSLEILICSNEITISFERNDFIRAQ